MISPPSDSHDKEKCGGGDVARALGRQTHTDSSSSSRTAHLPSRSRHGLHAERRAEGRGEEVDGGIRLSSIINITTTTSLSMHFLDRIGRSGD